MRAQIVHNESNAFGVGKVLFNQPTNAFGPSASHVVILDINPTPAHKRGIKLDQMSHTIALVFNIVFFQISRSGWQHRTHFLDTLHARFIHAYHRVIDIQWWFVNLQNVLHRFDWLSDRRTDKGRILLRRDTPHFSTPRLKGVFLKLV